MGGLVVGSDEAKATPSSLALDGGEGEDGLIVTTEAAKVVAEAVSDAFADAHLLKGSSADSRLARRLV